MKQIFTFFTLILTFLISTDLAFGACGVHSQQTEVQTRQRSSVVIPEETESKNFKELATVSKKEAKKIATTKYSGKVKKAELITEEGTLVWKLEVKGNQGQKEMFVDPSSGEFLGYGLTK